MLALIRKNAQTFCAEPVFSGPAPARGTHIREKFMKERDRSIPITRQYIPCNGHIRVSILCRWYRAEFRKGVLNGKPIWHQYVLRRHLASDSSSSSTEIRLIIGFYSVFKKAFSISCKIVRAFGIDRRPIQPLLENHLYLCWKKVGDHEAWCAETRPCLIWKNEEWHFFISLDRPQYLR